MGPWIFYETCIHCVYTFFVFLGLKTNSMGALHNIEISQITLPLLVFLILLESCGWSRVHQVSFIMFQPMVEKLLNIEQNFH